MKKAIVYGASIFMCALVLSINNAQAQMQKAERGETKSNSASTAEFQFTRLLAQARPSRRAGFSLMPANSYVNVSGPMFNIYPMAAGPNLQVMGSGTLGRLTKWTGFTSSNSFIGNSTIFEDKYGMVGIGTDTPRSRLTVAGLIESINGGFKFPDGTIQTTAGLSSLVHDATLMGSGTSNSPLGVAVPLSLSGSVEGTGAFDDAAIIRAFNSNNGRGVSGISTGGIGVFGGSNSRHGVSGLTFSSENFGVVGTNFSTGTGVSGSSSGGTGVHGTSDRRGVLGEGNGGLGIGVEGRGVAVGVVGFSNSGDGVSSESNGDSATAAVRGVHNADGTGVRGKSTSGDGVVGETSNNTPLNLSAGVVGINSGSAASFGPGVLGRSSFGSGVVGVTDDFLAASVGSTGVYGVAVTGTGVFGSSVSSDGVRGHSGSGLAGKFDGDVEVTGNLTKGGGSFKIDHPLDPENKYLYHSFVESPDMMNIYNGNAVLNDSGEAVVKLPEWFEALNKDFRYSLTAIGAPAPGLYIAEKVANNRFKIAGGQPGMEVSWQVTGIRRDHWANKHRIKVEEEKPEKERDYYLHPELYNQPEEKSVEWARHPQLMQQMKEAREQMKQQSKQRINDR